jgi:hypothetical protein
MVNYGRLKSFVTHCQSKGIELMRDDIAYIDRMLNKLPKNDFKAVLTLYVDEWVLGKGQNKNAQGAQGNGRRRANLWLLAYCNEVEQKKTAHMVPSMRYERG